MEFFMAFKNLPFSVWALLITLTVVSLVSSFMGTWLLYREATVVMMDRLTVAANTQSKMIELLVGMGNDEKAISEQLNKMSDYEGFGETGEFVIGHKEADVIHIITKLRHQTGVNDTTIPRLSDIAEPLRLGLAGGSGTIEGPDYRGVNVMAAYNMVPNTGFAVVAKIDADEVNGQYLTSFLYALLSALVIALCGGGIVYHLNEQVIEDLKTSRRNAQKGFEGIIQALSHTLDTRDPYTGGQRWPPKSGQDVKLVLTKRRTWTYGESDTQALHG
jgi:hypothetical protein